MFFLGVGGYNRDVTRISRLSWGALAAGLIAFGLFALPIALSLYVTGVRAAPMLAFGLSWLGSGVFCLVALYAGYVSQFRLRARERPSLILAVLGGALGLATLIMMALALLSLLAAAG